MSMLSAVRTIIVDRQVPYAVQLGWDRFQQRAGHTEKVITEGDFRFRIRRLTCDVNFVQNIIVDREYLPQGITIGPTDTVVDIGGNIGTFAVLAGSLATRVIVAEPEPENLRLLRYNLALNGRTNVTVVPCAVAGTAGEIVFYVSREGGYHTMIDGQLQGGRGIETRVQAVTLADIWRYHAITRCDLLKVDCEGAEYDIFPHTSDALLSTVRQIAMEYHAHGGDIDPILARLTGLGFRVLRHEVFARGGHVFLTH